MFLLIIAADKKQKAQLLQGKTIYINSADICFLYYGQKEALHINAWKPMRAIKLPLGESVISCHLEHRLDDQYC